MRRLAALVLILAVVTGLAAYAQNATASAVQDDDMANHPVVGAWRWENDPPGEGDVFISYGIFHADGTYVEVGIDNITSVGVWEATGERTAFASFYFADLDPDPNVVAMGEGRQWVEVDESGNAITADIDFKLMDGEGNVLFADDDVKSWGTRLILTPMEMPEVPAEATPEA